MGNHLLVFSLRVWGSGRRCMGFVEDVAEQGGDESVAVAVDAAYE